MTYVGLALLVDKLLVLEQELHSLDKLRIDGVQQGVLGLHPHDDEQLYHLQVLVVYR